MFNCSNVHLAKRDIEQGTVRDCMNVRMFSLSNLVRGEGEK